MSEPVHHMLTYPAPGGGRRAFPTSGAGGTLNVAGTKPGGFYRAPAVAGLAMPGLVAFRAIRDGRELSVNDYAVHCAVRFLQRVFAETVDGIHGPKTDAKLKAWQGAMGLKADGVYGPASARALLGPIVAHAVVAVDAAHASELVALVRGHIAYESGWDHGAVGGQDPRDLGIAQIHTPVHTSVSATQAFDPEFAIPWMARFVDGNLEAMNYNVRDAVAAYNLGKGGARSWIAAGRPDLWTPAGSSTPRNMKRYIDQVLSGA